MPERNQDLSLKQTYIKKRKANSQIRLTLNKHNQQYLWEYYEKHPYYANENELINTLITQGMLNQELHQVLKKVIQAEIKEQGYQSLSEVIKTLVDAVNDLQTTVINQRVYENPLK